MTQQPKYDMKPSTTINHFVYNNKLFVGAIGMTIAERELTEYFSQFGEIMNVIVKRNPRTRLSRGYGFIDFKDAKSVDAVVQFNRLHFIGNKKVNPSRLKNTASQRSETYRNLSDELPLHDRRLFISGFGKITSERELYDYFIRFGELEDVVIKFDTFSGISKGYGFIQFVNTESADKVMEYASHYIRNRIVQTKRAMPRQRYSFRSKIFVGGLAPEITEHEIIQLFNEFGQICEFYQPFDVVNNQKRGFCFLTYKDYKVVNEVLKNPIQVINGVEIYVKRVKINPWIGESSRRINTNQNNYNNSASYMTVSYNHATPFLDDNRFFQEVYESRYGMYEYHYEYDNGNDFYTAGVYVSGINY